MQRGGFGEIRHGLLGQFGGLFLLLLLDGYSTLVSGCPLFPLENLRPVVEVVGQKVARLLGEFGGASPLRFIPHYI